MNNPNSKQIKTRRTKNHPEVWKLKAMFFPRPSLLQQSLLSDSERFPWCKKVNQRSINYFIFILHMSQIREQPNTFVIQKKNLTHTTTSQVIWRNQTTKQRRNFQRLIMPMKKKRLMGSGTIVHDHKSVQLYMIWLCKKYTFWVGWNNSKLVGINITC